MHDHDTYDAADNSSKSYALAIRTIRLDKIRLGLIAPRPDDAEEMEAASNLNAAQTDQSFL